MLSMIYNAAPVLILLIIIEAVFMIKEHRPDNKDIISSILLAAGHLPMVVITKGFIILFYSCIYQYRIFTLPANHWWAWVICFFADDISYYWFHRISHKVRFFWASHMVHHSSEKFTLATGLRIPWTSDLTGNFVFWAWLPLIGIEPYMIIFMKSVGALYQFSLHTETIKKLPNWVEAIFNTPSHHRVHHSSNVEYLDKNHAGTLIIWDKLFGTYQEEISRPRYGLSKDIKSFNPFVIAFHEWKNIFSDIKKTKNIKSRINYFLKPPGWSHDGTSKTTKQLQGELGINSVYTHQTT